MMRAATKRVHTVAAGIASVLLAAGMIAAPPASAAEPGTVIVHFFSSANPAASAGVAVTTLAGDPVPQVSSGRDAFGEVTTWAFDGLGPQTPVGIAAAEDSVFPGDLRYVRAAHARTLEVWLVDGDARIYDSPIALDDAKRVVRDRSIYYPLSALVGPLALTTSVGSNGYEFDGAAPNTIDILTVTRGRDTLEIAMDANRIGYNVTSNMLDDHQDLVFDDVDGFRDGDDYFLSFAAIERLFQVGTLLHPAGLFTLLPLETAYDEVTDADPESTGFDRARLEELDAYLEGQVDQGFPGVSVSVTRNGKLVENEAFGYELTHATGVDASGNVTPATLLDEDRWEPADTDTLYDLASNTKMYATNYAIQRLVSEGRLDLDRTLQSFAGWETFTDANSTYTGAWTVGGTGGITAVHTGKETITIRDILHHNAGLIPDPAYPNRSSAGALWYQTADADDRSGIIDAISRTPLMYAPRTEFAYSDVDFMILGLLVEQITGQRLDVYMEHEFYRPLGLSSTMYTPLDRGIPADRIAATELNGNTRDGNVSFGTFDDGAPVPMREYTIRGEVHDEKAFYSMAGVAGHAGLFSTSGDMAVLTQLMLNGGLYGGREYFAAEVADEFTTPFSLDPNEVDASTIGLGWRVHSKDSAAYYYFNWGPSRSTYGHQGWTGTLTVIDPIYDITITVLTNLRHSPVTDPPNGFEGSDYDLSDLVAVSGYVYRALDRESTQYSTAASVVEADGVTAPLGTSESDALGLLPRTVSILDTEGRAHPASATWSVAGYDPDTPGNYAATASLDLPFDLQQPEDGDPVPLTATTTITLDAPAHSAPPSEGGTPDPGSDDEPGAPRDETEADDRLAATGSGSGLAMQSALAAALATIGIGLGLLGLHRSGETTATRASGMRRR